MKIPSFSKIEKQAESYTQNNFRADPFSIAELESLEKILHPLCQEWSFIRDEFCDGQICRCKTHPRYKEFFDQIEPLQEKISQINRTIYNSRCKMRKDKERELLLARAAKIHYIQS